MNDWASMQVAEAKANGRTTPELVQWVFSIATRALEQEFGPDFSIRCLQASETCRVVLEEIGIVSRCWNGAVCVATVYPGPPIETSWTGFWDQDHHVFLCTELSEIVDLSISQLHLHPAFRRGDALAVPAVWWYPVDQWPNPPIIKYLHDRPIAIELPNDEMVQLGTITAAALELVAQERQQGPDGNALAIPTLIGIESLNAMYTAGDPWVTAVSALFAGNNNPLPRWIVEREKELIRAYEARQGGAMKPPESPRT